MNQPLIAVPVPPLLVAPTPRVWHLLPLFLIYLSWQLVSAAMGAVVMAAKYTMATGAAPTEEIVKTLVVDTNFLKMVALSIGLFGIAISSFAAWRSPQPFRERLGLLPSRLSGSHLLLAALGALGVSLLIDPVLMMMPGYSDSAIAKLNAMFAKDTGVLLLGNVLLIGLLAPVAEELFFRGIVQTRLSDRYGPAVGIAVSALAFGVMHLDLLQGSFAVLMGVYLGFLRWRSGSVFPTILAHVINNTMAVLGSKLVDVPVVATVVVGLVLLALGVRSMRSPA